MWIVAVAWMYVAVMMAVAQATSPDGSLGGALGILVFYGLLPLSLVMYVLFTPHRNVPARHRNNANLTRGQRRRMQAACRPVTPSRLKEKNRPGSETVHHCPPVTWHTPRACNRSIAKPGKSAHHLPTAPGTGENLDKDDLPQACRTSSPTSNA